MFPITHTQAQTSIAKYQFISPGLLVSPKWLSLWATGSVSLFRLIKVTMSFLITSALIFLVLKPGNMFCFDP